MTASTAFTLWGESEGQSGEQLWARCEEAVDLFAEPPAPVRRRYELLGCTLEAELQAALGFLVLTPLDEQGEPMGRWEWYLEDARVLATRTCARDASRLDVTVEAVRSDQQPPHPGRPLAVGFRLSDAEDGLLGRFRDLAEVSPPEEPPPHSVRLLGCSLHGPLREVLEGRDERPLGYRHLDALDSGGAVLAPAGYPHIVDWQPSTRGPGLYDLTVHMDPQPPVVADIWALWSDGRPAVPNLWARFDRVGRSCWLDPALSHRTGPDRPAGGTYHLDGRHITDAEGFFCAVGEAVNGPGGYFGRCHNGFSDALGGGFGARWPFTLVWHDHEVARRCLGVQPLTSRPDAFPELLSFLREKGIDVVLA
ncbi:barstar family protein [Streptomyces sp. NBC_00091]|uniref:barstar family protein n=1 Tax=Streptomyces sp. NBC_00091 TaxID=2975648 RepID=UPI002250678C|nr:barstar family protein [Streptomyces sp. NBC_00091]MCX5376540.1 barstar family protein [Streptomyces sp. NBC_00091]